ncbi:MAG: tRNA (adenine(22)-N(1))-methyltransferase [Candidatus Izemoplasmataceae bacterium]
MPLSKRLHTCLQFTRGFQKLADIGTDHAFLPIMAVKEGYVYSALAIDNKEGPYDIAKKNVEKTNLQDKIQVIYSEGIKDIDEDVDVITINGLGGRVIKDILLDGDLKNVKRLVLQPNNEASRIRGILHEIGFYILDELVFEENKRIYDLLVLERGVKEYTDLEIEYGPINLTLKPHFFLIRVEKEIVKYEKIMPLVTTKEQQREIDAKIAELRSVL